MELTLGILIGIGLSAACGFRVFVPFLIVSIASLSGHLTLAPGFEWIGTNYAVAAFGIATMLEIAAYYVPWLDNLLDAAATPAAVVAGAVIMASVVHDASPFLKWSLAIIAGGGVAGIVQSGTVAIRGASTVTTGGIANPAVSTGEAAGSLVTGVLSIVLPVVAAVLAILACVLIIVKGRRFLRCRRAV